MKIRLMILALISFALLVGCNGGDKTETADGRLQVVATTGAEVARICSAFIRPLRRRTSSYSGMEWKPPPPPQQSASPMARSISTSSRPGSAPRTARAVR